MSLEVSDWYSPWAISRNVPYPRHHLITGSVSITSTYDSRTNDVESSLVARGDLWRVEASHGGSTSGSEGSPLFLIQLGPVLFVRHTTLLLPVHLSKQHLLWYGYDRKVIYSLAVQ
ncbi:hypothetical protein MA16_Dca018895 [Dendrobium catenatum]|uniref:Uncharacterized protein n=1 Tax=Dendrobium catenatum TaxID=906689 RepID=A0A2I0VW12_9ASPA|nr:hypothetical protein MA16_Dca018895 [Dendrobium catenatum]